MAECSHVPPDTQSLWAFIGYSGVCLPLDATRRGAKGSREGWELAGVCLVTSHLCCYRGWSQLWETARGFRLCYRGAKHLCCGLRCQPRVPKSK